MIIQGAFVNLSRELSSADFLAVVAAKTPNADCYLVDPPPGIKMTAAIDWRLVLRDPSAVASLSSTLWDAYESMISVLKRDDSETLPGVIIQIKNQRGASDQFVLGGDIIEKEVFFHRMKETVRTLAPKNNAEAVSQEIAETEESGFWEKLTS
jgi:hypothetical protein